jgi:predicted nucleic acid-binding protein
MSKMLQVRNVPDEVHRTLKARAAREGLSLSDFVKRELERTAERPSLHEWLDRAQQAKPLVAKRSPSDSLIVPHLLDVEVPSALRNLLVGQHIDSHRTAQFLSELATLPAVRFAHTPLLSRVWELRHNFTCYDAAYIALAEATGSVLYTSDAKLSKGHRARVKVFTH